MFRLRAKREEIRRAKQKGVFVGYDRESPAYSVYYPEVNKVERVRCVKFLEQRFYQSEMEEGEPFMPTPEQRVQLKRTAFWLPCEHNTSDY